MAVYCSTCSKKLKKKDLKNKQEHTDRCVKCRAIYILNKQY